VNCSLCFNPLLPDDPVAVDSESGGLVCPDCTTSQMERARFTWLKEAYGRRKEAR
jgi:hypothetical protein